MDDTTKTLLGLALRRGFTIAGTYLAGKGIVQGDAGVTSFVGAAMVLVEAGYEAWNRYGMVLVNAQLAKFKGVHPSQVAKPISPTSAPTLKILAFFAVALCSLALAFPAMAANTLPLPRPRLAAAAAAPTALTTAQNILSTAPADLNYAILLATQVNTPASNVRKQCYQAILAAIPTAPTGSTPPPGPEVVTHIEQAAELADTLNPSSPVFVNCAGAATLVGQNVLSFINAIVTGVAGIAILAPK